MPPSFLRFMDEQRQAFIALRRDLHQLPELGFQETRTSVLIAEKLRALGYQVEHGLAGTGVVGTLRRGSSGKALGLRADMDALPIEEMREHAHRSRNVGVMHACGHDGHVSMLLAAAAYLAQYGRFNGVLHLIFQPAEETLQGADRMLRDGVLRRFPCDAIFGMHTLPTEPEGVWFFKSGPAMASADYVRVTLHGQGGHAAHPHRTRDAVVAAASCIMALQTIASRNIDPQEFGVVSVVDLNGLSADNVIPEKVGFTVCVRAMDVDVRSALLTRIQDIVRLQANAFGVEADIKAMYGCPVLVNDTEQTVFAKRVASECFGKDRVREGKSRTGSEDFSYFLRACPGSFVFLGAGKADGSSYPLHHSCYDFNDDVLWMGAAFWVCLAQRFLADAPD